MINSNISSCAFGLLPPTNYHCSGMRLNDAISEDSIDRTLVDVLDIVIQGNISQHQLELMSYKPTTGTANHEYVT